MVSTDDSEIAEIARLSGAEVPFIRSRETANDHATTAQVLTEVLSEYKKIGQSFVIGCCIYPTAAFISEKQLGEAKRLLQENHSLSVIPIVRFGFPIQRALRLRDGNLSYFNPEFELHRSQDLEPAYHDAGQFYFFDVAQFLSAGQLINQTSLGMIISELKSQDIDNEDDWKLAELKWALLNRQDKCL
jgi:N-acylneuraminate cytidylyltransferase